MNFNKFIRIETLPTCKTGRGGDLNKAQTLTSRAGIIGTNQIGT